MEFAVIIALILVAITNVDMVIAMKKLQSHSVEIELSPPVTGLVECHCGAELFDAVKEVLQPLIVVEEPVKTPSVPDESYSAWKNQKEEPIVAPESPHGPPPV